MVRKSFVALALVASVVLPLARSVHADETDSSFELAVKKKGRLLPFKYKGSGDVMDDEYVRPLRDALLRILDRVAPEAGAFGAVTVTGTVVKDETGTYKLAVKDASGQLYYLDPDHPLVKDAGDAIKEGATVTIRGFPESRFEWIGGGTKTLVTLTRKPEAVAATKPAAPATRGLVGGLGDAR